MRYFTLTGLILKSKKVYYISLSLHSLFQNSDIAAITETNSNTKITKLSMPLIQIMY